jgi:hypothetical protein
MDPVVEARRPSSGSRLPVSSGGAAVINWYHRQIDADPGRAAGALEHLEPLRAPIEALEALGLHARPLPRSTREDGTAAYRLAIPIEDGGPIELAWIVSIEADGDGGSLVSVRQYADGTDAASRAHLRDSWLVLGPLAEEQAHRTLAMIEESAEE